MTKYKLRLAGSETLYSAPGGMTEEDAVRWIARMYHFTADREIKQLDDSHYEASNGHRGALHRGTVIEVVREAEGGEMTKYRVIESPTNGTSGQDCGTYTLEQLTPRLRAAVECEPDAGEWRLPALSDGDSGIELDDLQVVVKAIRDGMMTKHWISYDCDGNPVALEQEIKGNSQWSHDAEAFVRDYYESINAGRQHDNGEAAV